MLTTHYMEEAERLCDRIAIIDHGTVLDVGTAKELVQKYIGAEVIELDMGADKNYWLSRIQGLNFQEFENKIFIFFQSKIGRAHV